LGIRTDFAVFLLLYQAYELEDKDKAVARKLAEAKKALKTFKDRQRLAFASAFSTTGSD